MNVDHNAAAESFNAKIKTFRAQLRGVVDINFFLFRLAKYTPNKQGFTSDFQ